MTSKKPSNNSFNQRVAIVGGGYSGALVLANLIDQATMPFEIDWFEASDTLGTGVAYSTQDTEHLLNVRAERMGAFANKADHFYQWLQSDTGKQAAQKIWPDRTITAESYVPRTLYGVYIRNIVEESLKKAKTKDIDVNISHATVTDAELTDAESQKIALSVDRGGLQREVQVDALVLATGTLPPRKFSFQSGLIRGSEFYVADVWHTPKDHLYPHQVNTLSADSEIVIIGSGLTMVDAVMTLTKRGYKGKITAISRHGELPAAHHHSKPYPKWHWVEKPEAAPRTALGLLRGLRKEIAWAQSQGHDWRSVVDSLRPVTQTLWKQLSTTEKRRFLAKLFTLWNIHRHRMAPDIHSKLKELQQNGTLTIAAGKIYYVGSDTNGLTVAYRKRGANRVETIRPALVLNCTGPEYDIASSDHRLLKNLRDKELITIGPLRIGIEMTETLSAKGRAQDAIFPLGALLIGELFECTAVPELREHTHQVAAAVLTRLQTSANYPSFSNTLMLAAWI